MEPGYNPRRCWVSAAFSPLSPKLEVSVQRTRVNAQHTTYGFTQGKVAFPFSFPSFLIFLKKEKEEEGEEPSNGAAFRISPFVGSYCLLPTACRNPSKNRRIGVAPVERSAGLVKRRTGRSRGRQAGRRGGRGGRRGGGTAGHSSDMVRQLEQSPGHSCAHLC